MKLYVINSSNQKVYLNITANTRQGLANKIGGQNFYLGNDYYTVRQVWAEKDNNSTAAGAVVGGLVGALGGPVGIVIGGLLGGLLGNESDDEETSKVNRFNNSR